MSILSAKQERFSPVPIGSAGLSIRDLEDLPLGDLSFDRKRNELTVQVPEYKEAAPITEATRIKIKRGNAKPEILSAKPTKTESFLNAPMTVGRSLKWKTWTLGAGLLLGGTALTDKFTGGQMALHTVDAAVSTADFAYRHLKPKVNVEEAIEWGVALSQPLKFLHTDPDGTLMKNEAAIEAKHRFPRNPEKVREAVLPVLFTVDAKNILVNYGFRNAIAIRNYPDLSQRERGLILAHGMLKDIHASHGAADELKSVPISDKDILSALRKHPEIVTKMPETLRLGVNMMIADMLNADRDARMEERRQYMPKPLVLEQWQKDALEAELPPMPTQEEIRRSEQVMDQAMRKAEEDRRPKTLGELSGAQRRAAAPQIVGEAEKRVQGLSGQMRSAAQNAVQAAPSPWTAAYCNVKVAVLGGSFPKCVL